MKVSKEEKAQIVKELRELLKPGDTVYTKLNHVSRSGMLRHIEVLVFRDNQPRYLSWSVGRLLGYTQAKDDGLKVGGCGMDMGFEVVYRLSYALYHDIGYKCLLNDEGKGRCPSNYHVNSHNWTNTGEPIHHDGYALNHRWI